MVVIACQALFLQLFQSHGPRNANTLGQMSQAFTGGPLCEKHVPSGSGEGSVIVEEYRFRASPSLCVVGQHWLWRSAELGKTVHQVLWSGSHGKQAQTKPTLCARSTNVGAAE